MIREGEKTGLLGRENLPTLNSIEVNNAIVIDSFINITPYRYLLNSEKSKNPPTKNGPSNPLKNDFGAFLLSNKLIIEKTLS